MDITQFYERLWQRIDWRIFYSLFRIRDGAIDLFATQLYQGLHSYTDLCWRYAVTGNQLEGLDRLMDAASVLESVPEAEFNLRSWREKIDCGGCGTVGCVAHHYAVARPESGLTLNDNNGFVAFPEFKGARGMDAMSRFFCITIKEAAQLFDRVGYPGDFSERVSRQQVIDRIRAFVADKKKESEGV